MKKIWIGIAAAVIVVAVALLLALDVRKEPKEDTQSEGLYAVQYVTVKQGLDVTVDGPFPEDSVWTAESAGDAVQVSLLRSSRKSAVFRVEPGMTGVGTADLRLMDGASELYSIAMAFYTNADGAITVMNSAYAEAKKPILLEGFEILPGSGSVQVKAPASEVWTAECSGEQVSADENTDEEQSVFTLRCRAQSQGTVRLCSEQKQQALVLELSADANGWVTLLSQNMELWNPSGAAEGGEQFAALFGEPKLPADAELVESGLQSWDSRQEDGKSCMVGCVRFRLNDRDWTLYVGGKIPVEAFTGTTEVDASAKKIMVERTVAYATKDLNGCYCGWTSYDGTAYYLTSTAQNLEQTALTAYAVMQRTEHG